MRPSTQRPTDAEGYGFATSLGLVADTWALIKANGAIMAALETNTWTPTDAGAWLGVVVCARPAQADTSPALVAWANRVISETPSIELDWPHELLRQATRAAGLHHMIRDALSIGTLPLGVRPDLLALSDYLDRGLRNLLESWNSVAIDEGGDES